MFAAVYHAEVVAHRTGEPFGTLVLAIAVTVIEVALIISVMIAAPAEKTGLARDTVFAAVMIVCNGIVGLCLLWGGARHHEQGFQVLGANLHWPSWPRSLSLRQSCRTSRRVFPVRCLARRSSSLPALSRWCSMADLFLFRPCGIVIIFFRYLTMKKHTRRHLPTGPPLSALASCFYPSSLLSALPKSLMLTLEIGVRVLDVPKAVTEIVIAALVLMPEGLAALRAARANRLQTSLNLALGSALASIGLTIPAVAVVSIALRQPLELGLGEKDQVLLALTLFISVITLGTGRTTVLQGVVHLAIFTAFLFLALVP